MNNEKAIAQKIKERYETPEPEFTKLDELKMLDKKVKQPAIVFAYVFGTIGALILGLGMCLAMQIIAHGTVWLILGIVIGLVGIVIVSINNMLYNRILAMRKRKYSKEIIAKSNELLNK